MDTGTPKFRLAAPVALALAFYFFGSLIPAAPLRADAAVNHGIWAELLARHVNNGRVDYAGIKAREDRLDQYLKVLEDTSVDNLSREEKFAFYINAYNAWTVKLILSGYPGVKSIKDLGSRWNPLKTPWKKKICRLDGKLLSLDQIEHDILRPEFKDARVHFAINCAARSCPPLLSEPYRGAALSRQLDSSTRAFINNPRNTYLKGDTLHVSRIFKWFEEDFDGDAVGFVKRYAEGSFRVELDGKSTPLPVEYLDYDWSLNGK